MNGELLTRNYKKIKEIAVQIAKDRSLADDLINETYLLLNKRGVKMPQDDTGFIKVYSKFMKYQAIPETGNYRRYDYQKLVRPKEVRVFDMNIFEELESEISDHVTKEIMLAEIGRFKRTLNSLELVLFELHYEMGLDLTKIIKMYSEGQYEMSFNCLWVMYRPLKQKIKNFKWKL